MEWRDLGQVKGDPGKDGVGLEFMWDGTRLGVKKETDTEYQFVNLQAESNINESEIEELIENIKLKNIIEIVDTLPERGSENVIYLKARSSNQNSTTLYALQSSLDETNDTLNQILEKIEDNSLLNIIQVKETLPDTGNPNTLYFISKGDGEYNIYTYINQVWVKLNPNDNLSEYAINNLIKDNLSQRDYNIVEELPEEGLENTLYFVENKEE